MIWCDACFLSQLPTANTYPKWFSGFYGQSRTIITTPVVLRFFCMDFNLILVYTFKCNFFWPPNLRTWNTKWRHLYANYHLRTVLYSIYTQICFPQLLFILKTSHLWYLSCYSICSPLEYFIHFHNLEYSSHYITMTPKSKSPPMNKWISVTDLKWLIKK